MQNIVQKNKELEINDIIDFYRSKETFSETIGLEYERISIDKESFGQASFENLFEIIKAFSAANDFEIVYDNETIIGAKNSEGSSVSLEPGGQFEISLSPKVNLYEIQFVMNNYLNQIDNLGDMYKTKFFGIGNNPKVCYQNMEILDKRRYKLMAKYLIKQGKMASVMMRETAGVQINIDYKNCYDAKRKVKAACLMSPFLTGFFANSPFRNNKLTNYKSIRALAWKFTGADRCNLFYRDIIDKNGSLYEQYTNYILDVPMIFIIRDNNYIEINGKITFREFMKNGYLGYRAGFDDYMTHQSLCFPDVRLKNCIEIRNHDSQNLEVAIGIAAIYKGILYFDSSVDEVISFLSPLNSIDLEKTGFLAARYGVRYMVEKLKMPAYEVVKRLLLTAQKHLKDDEKIYLEWLIELVNSKRCIADLVLETIK